MIFRIIYIILLITLFTLVKSSSYEDVSELTREDVMTQIDNVKKFIETKKEIVHPSKLQSHWLQLGMLYQVISIL